MTKEGEMFHLVGMAGLGWMDISLDIQTHLLKKRCVEPPKYIPIKHRSPQLWYDSKATGMSCWYLVNGCPNPNRSRLISSPK